MAKALEDIEIPNELPVKERIRLEPTNRRIRVVFNGVALADSEKTMLLLERNHLPVYYFPKRDVKMDQLSQTEQHTTCPIKGQASYWTVTVGDRSADNAAWGYPRPIEGAPDLRDYVAFYWEKMDAWFEEDEKVFGHPKNPYHRIDVLHSSKHVLVRVDGELIADSNQPRLLIETQLPVRYYLPRIDVRMELLEPSITETWCAYKGKATYWSIKLPSGRTLKDAVWTYDPPQPEYAKINGLLCFYNEKVSISVLPGSSDR